MNKEAAKHNLLEIKNIFDKLHIKFWLAHGTLLGAVREKGFISYDFDLDGAILATDWSPQLCSKFMKYGFACSTRKSSAKRPAQLRIVKRGIVTHVGLKYYYPPENIYFSLPNVPTVRNATLPAKLLKGDYFIHFLGAKFRVPNPPQEYLEWLYGKNWRTPVNDLSWQKAWKKISLDKYLKWLDEHPISQHRELK
ncbi:hypothetical protein ES703_40359 [subsurface metagenome]